MPNVLPGLDGAWGKCFETYKHFKDRPETKEYKEMAHGKGKKRQQRVARGFACLGGC